MNSKAFALSLLLVAFVPSTNAIVDSLFGPECQDISPVADFDIDEYVAASWYIQRQQTNIYQPADSLFCVVATYEMEGRRQFFQEAISVFNFSNRGAINQGGGGGPSLCATRRSSDTGQLAVAPCFLPPFLGGAYWVAAYSPGRWSIVTGGQPNVEGSCSGEEDLCTTRESFSILDPLTIIGNNQGLWFLTRDRFPDDALLAEMEAAAADLGICTSGMLDVVHEGCTYEGAVLKP